MVAHGLGMSVNGQDPRSNVYLLDGTPQNDFTNGPAGSAAGTALGTGDGARVPRRDQRLQRRVRPQLGGQINVLTKSGTNESAAAAARVPPQRRLRRAQLLRHRRQARLLAQPVRRHPRRAAQAATDCSSSSATRACARSSARRSRPSCQTTTRGRAFCRTRRARCARRRRHPAVAPYLDEFPRRTARDRRRHRGPHVPVRPAAGPALRAGPPRLQPRRRAPVLRAATPSTTRDQRLPTDFPQFPRTFLSRNQFFTAEHRQCCRRRRSTRCGSASAARASARTSSPTRRTPLHAVHRRAATAWATSTSAGCRGSARRARPNLR